MAGPFDIDSMAASFDAEFERMAKLDQAIADAKEKLWTAMKAKRPALSRESFEVVFAGMAPKLRAEIAGRMKVSLAMPPAPPVPAETTTVEQELAIARDPEPVIDSPPPGPTPEPAVTKAQIRATLKASAEPVSFKKLQKKHLAPKPREDHRAKLADTLVQMQESGEVIAPTKGEDTYTLYDPENEPPEIAKIIADNQMALGLVQKGGHDREVVNRAFKGLGGAVRNTKGIFGMQEKRAANLQQHYTSPAVAEFIVEMLDIAQDATVLDPACGSGRLLFACPNPRMVHGIEIEHDAFTVAKAQFPNGVIVNDSLINHVFDALFDYVVMNPPFTLTLEDWHRKLRYAASLASNRVLSDVAVLEIATRALKPGGFFAVIGPAKLFTGKLSNSVSFLNWLYSEVVCLAEIDLPAKTTHSSGEWPVKVWVFQRFKDADPKHAAVKTTPQRVESSKVFKEIVTDLGELPAILAKWKESPYWSAVRAYGFSRKSKEQVRFRAVDVQAAKVAIIRGSPQAVTSEDVIEVSITDEAKTQAWTPDPMSLQPNGLGAGLKTAAFSSLFPSVFNEDTGEYVEVLQRFILQAGAITAGRLGFDDHDAVKRLRGYDAQVRPSPQFIQFMEEKQRWVDIQNVPFAQEVNPDNRDPLNNDSWTWVNTDLDYETTYPALWTGTGERLETLKAEYPFLERLFSYQKKDARRLALKASSILASTMGTGKSRTAIAVALLKQTGKPTLLVVPSKLVNNWRKEFVAPLDHNGCALDAPFRIKFREDIKEVRTLKPDFCIVSMEDIRRPWENVKSMPSKERREAEKWKIARGEEEPEENPETGALDDVMLEYEIEAEDWGTWEDTLTHSDALREANPKKPSSEQDAELRAEASMRLKDKVDRMSDHIHDLFGMVIVDEAHILANPDTSQASGVRKLQPANWMFLTGTPIANRVRGLYSLLEIGWGRKTGGNPLGPQQFLTTFQRTMTSDELKAMEQVMLQKVFGDSPEAYASFIRSYGENLGYTKKKDQEDTKGAKFEVPGIDNQEQLIALMESKWLRRVKWEPEVRESLHFIQPTIIVHNPEMDPAHKEWYKKWFKEVEVLIKLLMRAKCLEKEKSLKQKQTEAEMARLRAEEAGLEDEDRKRARVEADDYEENPAQPLDPMKMRYSVAPFSRDYSKNYDRSHFKEGQQPCAICGRPVDTAKAITAVVCVGHNKWWADLVQPEDEYCLKEGPSFEVVGPDCHRRFFIRENAAVKCNAPGGCTAKLYRRHGKYGRWECPVHRREWVFVPPQANPDDDEEGEEEGFEEDDEQARAVAIAEDADRQRQKKRKKCADPTMWGIGRLLIAAMDPHNPAVHHVQGERIKSMDGWAVAPSWMQTLTYNKLTGRHMEIIKMVEEETAKGKRIYIITQFKSTVFTFDTELRARGFKTLVIHGGVSMANRYKMLHEIEDDWDPRTVIVATIGTMDTGLNLPEADICLITNPHYNYSKMQQAWSRMLRPASKGEKLVHIFVQKGTVEDYAWRLADIKRFNVDRVLDRANIGVEPDMMRWRLMVCKYLFDAENGVERDAGRTGELNESDLDQDPAPTMQRGRAGPSSNLTEMGEYQGSPADIADMVERLGLDRVEDD